MTKYFVLRPHALLSSEDSLQKFGEDNVVVVPLAVIDEIQSWKDLKREKAKVRGAILKYLRYAAINGALTKEGFKQENGSILRIEVNCKDVHIDASNLTEFQSRTLKVCKELQDQIEKEGGKPDKKVILITNNTALQIKAYTLGINAEYFRDEIFPELAQQYKGTIDLNVCEEIIDKMYKERKIKIDEIYGHEDYVWIENCFVTMNCERKSRVFAMVKGDELIFQDSYTRPMYGLKPLTDNQRLFMSALNSDCRLIIVKGPAGVGKTLVPLADALARYEKGEFKKIYITSPVCNENLGYLPGDIDDKVTPFISGIKNNLELLVNGLDYDEEDTNGEDKEKAQAINKKKLRFEGYPDDPFDKEGKDFKKDFKEDGSYFFERGIIKIVAISTLRGACIMKSYFIIDEAQNIKPSEMKTIITRMGKGSKFIICGDPTQVDIPSLSERYNGLVYAAETMKGVKDTAIVTFKDDDSLRDEIAREAAKRM
jgi:PhoH-like ATPase